MHFTILFGATGSVMAAVSLYIIIMAASLITGAILARTINIITAAVMEFPMDDTNPAAVSGGEAVSAMPYPHQAIKDSAAENNRTDPYKNSILQD